MPSLPKKGKGRCDIGRWGAHTPHHILPNTQVFITRVVMKLAWIEVHQTLPNHRKTLAAAAILDISPVQMIGHLICLWLWALDNAPDGVMYTSRNALRNKMVATVSQWDGDPDAFVDALVESGFLDERDDALEVHDWYDYAGKLMETRKANRERQRRYRESKKQQEANVERNANVTRDVTVTKSERHAPTVPYRTLPNINTLTSELPKPGSPNQEIETQDPVKPKPSKPVFDETCEAYQLASHLRDCILAREPTTKVPNDLQRWYMDADRMLRIDNRDYNESRRLIEWCQHDDFWCTNILSMGKFRKHFDQLKRKSQHAQGQKSHERTLEDVLEDLRREGV